MRIAIRATEDAIIRLLKAGYPLPGHMVNRHEETRLPVFQSIEPVPTKTFGLGGTHRVVLARGRKDVWFVDIKRRGAVDDGNDFLTLHEAIKAHYKGLKVTGWLVSTDQVSAGACEQLAAEECLVTAGAARR
ncbi:MAG: hypothetical protein ACYTF0_03790 [Planctomycetota bacterium]|jgi:hypothetical protein